MSNWSWKPTTIANCFKLAGFYRAYKYCYSEFSNFDILEEAIDEVSDLLRSDPDILQQLYYARRKPRENINIETIQSMTENVPTSEKIEPNFKVILDLENSSQNIPPNQNQDCGFSEDVFQTNPTHLSNYLFL